MPSVLFVCTANICRSPMAEALFRHRLHLLGVDAEWSTDSAGTWATDGMPASKRCQIVMKEWGADISSHRAKSVNHALVSSFDLILVMSKDHKEALRLEFPASAHKIYMLSEMVGNMFDIPDPINGTLEDVRISAQDIQRILGAGFEEIVRKTSNQNSSTRAVLAHATQPQSQ